MYGVRKVGKKKKKTKKKTDFENIGHFKWCGEDLQFLARLDSKEISETPEEVHSGDNNGRMLHK